MASDEIPRKLLRRVEVPGAVTFVAQSQDQPFSETTEHEHNYGYVWMIASGDYSEWIRGQGERSYKPFRWSYHPPGERHVHKTGALPPVSVGISLVDAELVAKLPARSCMVVGPRYVEIGIRLYRSLMSEPFDGPAIESAWSDMLEVLLGQVPERLDSPPEWINTVGTMLQDSYALDLTLESVASEIGVHPVHLASTYKKFTGVSFGEAIRELRLEHACVMLRQTDESIGEIATLCGFYDNAHLTRHFKRALGKTPQQFRLLHRS